MFFINLTMLRPGFFYLTAERKANRRAEKKTTYLRDLGAFFVMFAFKL